MGSQLYLRLGTLALLAAMAVPQRLSAQFLSCSEGHSQISHPVQYLKITIADVEFSGANPLPDDVRTQLANRIKRLDLHAIGDGDDADWLAQVEVPIREVLQGQGYFRVFPAIKPYLIRSESHEPQYMLVVDVDSGPQYRLGQMNFSGATIFTIRDLREQFPLRHGDLFDVTQLRNGMAAMTKAYSKKGFIDMVPEPEFQIDEKSLLVDVAFRIDEGKQYHVRTVEIHGLNAALEQVLKSEVAPAQVFDAVAFHNFFIGENRPELPKNVQFDEAIRVFRDTTNAAVDIRVDFRPCPATYRDLNLPILGR